MKSSTSLRPSGRTLASSVALLGALGMMGFSSSAQAGLTVPSPPDCPADPTTTANYNPFAPNSAVTDLVLDDGNGTWTYEFRVCNTSDAEYGGFLLRDWELPWDHTASNPIDESTIAVPAGWAWSIETRGVDDIDKFGIPGTTFTGWDGDITWQDPNDPFFDPRFATQPQVLHFYTFCGEDQGTDIPQSVNAIGTGTPCFLLDDATISAGDSLAGFGFQASVGPTNAPYQASWTVEPPRSGDPAFPLVGGTALSSAFFSVPEPSSLLLLGASLGGIAGAAAVRRRRKDEKSEDTIDS